MEKCYTEHQSALTSHKTDDKAIFSLLADRHVTYETHRIKIHQMPRLWLVCMRDIRRSAIFVSLQPHSCGDHLEAALAPQFASVTLKV